MESPQVARLKSFLNCEKQSYFVFVYNVALDQVNHGRVMNRETGRNYNGLKTTELREKVNKSRISKLNLGLREERFDRMLERGSK